MESWLRDRRQEQSQGPGDSGEGPRPGRGESVKTAPKFCLGAVFVSVT